MSTKKIFFFLILILAVAAFFRFYKLAEIPPGLYPDVAINGTDALDALQNNDFRVFYPENNGREGLFMNLIALSFHFFGVSVWAIKVVPAIIGFLTVLGFYLMTRELFSYEIRKNTNIRNALNDNNESFSYIRKSFVFRSDIIALLSTFFLSVSFWHVNFSRLGFRAIMVPFFLVWGFFFFFKATRMAREKRANETDNFSKAIRIILYTSYFILAGLTFGLGFHTYISYRVFPAILGIAFLIEIYNLWRTPKEERHAIKLILLWLLLFVMIIIAASPLIIYFYHHPQDFMGRTGQVSVLSSENPLKELAISSAKSLGMFNIQGDCNWRHNYNCQPALPLPVGILFLIGFFFSIKEVLRPALRKLNFRRGNLTLKQSEISAENASRDNWIIPQISLFLLTWFFAMLLPEILTNEGLPHSLRAIGAIPPVYVFAGIGGAWIIGKFITNYRKITIAMAVAFCLWLVLYSYDNYFIQWGKNNITRGAFTQHLVDIGNYLNGLPEDAKKYVIVNEGGVAVPYPNGIPMPAQTILFVEQTSPSINKARYLKPNQVSWFHGLGPAAKYPVVFTLLNYDQQILNQLQQADPNGVIKQEENDIWTFTINPNGKIQMTNQ
jgi:hypothetical protein